MLNRSYTAYLLTKSGAPFGKRPSHPQTYLYRCNVTTRCRLRQALGLSCLELLEAPRTTANGGRPLLVILSHWGLDRPRPLPPRAVLVGPVADCGARAAVPLAPAVEEWLSGGQTAGGLALGWAF